MTWAMRSWVVVRRLPAEAFVWTAGVAALACTDPRAAPLVSLCVFKALGVPFCPGCGLGHAVAFLFRGELARSFTAHPLGAFAVAVIALHVAGLVRDALRPPTGSPATPSSHP